MAYKQAMNRRRRLIRTYNETKNCYGSGVWYDEDKGRYIKSTASNTPGYAKLLRKYGNKKVRQSKDTFNNAEYRRVFDYKWTLY